jgi:hypothetical protein
MELRLPQTEDGPMLRARAMKYAATMYPELIPEIDKVHWLVRAATNEKDAHYCRVVGKVGAPQAAILTRTENNLWAMKKHSVVLLWYSEIPGAGAALLRGFRDWVFANKQQVVMAGFSCDWVLIDDRPLRLAERIGFKQRGEGMYVYFPRGSKA